MQINTAGVVKQFINFIYHLSPYFWVDNYYRNRELAYEPESNSWNKLRGKRLFLSEFYIVGWLTLSIVLYVSTLYFEFSVWLVIILAIRIFGIVNKELGVILFGICKVTEGSMVSATGRVIVLAMVNYLTAMFLFASIYQIAGSFDGVPSYFVIDYPISGFIQAVNVQFTMNGAFAPDDAFTWLVTTSQGVFCFVFGTIVISLFVSLLSVKPLKA